MPANSSDPAGGVGPEPAPPAFSSRPGISGRCYYGIILAGLVLGAAVSSLIGWTQLTGEKASPAGILLVPICIMVGAILGGVAGVAAAVASDRFSRSSVSREIDHPMRG